MPAEHEKAGNRTNSIRLEILGCGTSTGVPLPACRCDVCRSSLPRNQRLRPAALFSTPSGANILVDAGPDLRAQVLRAAVDHVDAVLYTHAHADHIFGTDDLRCFNYARPGTIPCYGTAETLSHLSQTFRYIFDPQPDYPGGAVAQLELKPVRESELFQVDGVSVQPFPLLHGPNLVLGYRCGDIAYATDCNAIPPEALAALRGVRYLVLDALRFEPHRTHFSVPEAVNAARQIGAEKTYLTHLAHSIDYEKVQRQLPSDIELAYDGLIIEA